jgi:hypothetical protein
MTEPLPDVRTCACLPMSETLSRGLTGKPVPRCELHGTLGSAGKQGTDNEADALNSEALERKLGDSLGAALNKPRFLDL